MSFQPGELVEVTTEGVAQGGWCVARPPDGPVVFVRHALPGERVVARVTEVTSRLARADAIEVRDASPDRVVAPCPSARPGGCGGCDWQHATLPAQRALKAAVVAEQLRRLAGLDREVIVEALPGDEDGNGLGWRTRMQFAVDDDGVAGLRGHRSHEVIDVGDCLIAHPGIRDLGIPRRRWTGATAVEVAVAADPGEGSRQEGRPQPGSREAQEAGPESGGREAREVGPQSGTREARENGPEPGSPHPGRRGAREVGPESGGREAHENGPQPGSPQPGRREAQGPAAYAGSPGEGGVRGVSPLKGVEGAAKPPWETQREVIVVSGSRPAEVPDVGAESVLSRYGRKLAPVRGRPYLTQRAAGRDWKVSAGGFWQVHPAAAGTLTAAVLAALEPKPGDTALDLYCGAGLFTGALAAAVGPDGAVTGVESDEAAVRDARHNLREFPWARVHRGDVGAAARGAGAPAAPPRGRRAAGRGPRGPVLPQARLAVADPPRSGLDRAVIGYLSAARSGTERFCYVSCDPATLARDIGLLLARGWALEGLRAFDAFPMTHHVECVAWLLR